VTRPFSIPYKQKMIERMTGKGASSARQLSRETGVSQETLSRWLREAHSLPLTKAVRFDAIDSMLTSATENDGAAIAATIRLLVDPEPSVRRKVVRFLARSSAGQLRAAVKWLETKDEPEKDLASRSQRLLEGSPHTVEAVVEALNSDSQLDRFFAIAAATRHDLFSDKVLAAAQESGDPDVATLAQWEAEDQEYGRRRGRDKSGRPRKPQSE
jgi:hypothetical protein